MRCPTGISVSSLSDGLFVLHVPSDDNKQKVRTAAYVWMEPSGWLWGFHGLLVLLAGRCDSAERPRHRDADQDRHLCRENQQHQHQPGQVRSRTSGGSQINLLSSCLTTLVLLRSIKFTVGQGKEGIIDFTPGSELIVAKAKNGHLSVVRQPNALVFGWFRACRLASDVLTCVGGALDSLSDSWRAIDRTWRLFLLSVSFRRPPGWTPDDNCTCPPHRQEPSDSRPLPPSNHERRPRSASANRAPAAAT